MQTTWSKCSLLIRVLSVAVLVAHSLDTIAAPRVERDVVFDTPSGQELKLDIYRPESDVTSHAVVLLIHGGGWAGGDKDYHKYIGLPLANAGYLAISANYRLAPKYKYPAGVEDCQSAMRWVRKHAADYGGDSRRLVLMGESAGGHLSSLLGLWDWTSTGTLSQGATDGTRVTAVVNVFGPADLTGFENIEFCRDLLKNFIGGTESQLPGLYREISPINHVTKPGPAFLHIHGTKDVLVPVDQSRRFHAKLKEMGYDSTLLIFEGANHGWPPESDEGKKAETSILVLLQRTLKPR